MIMNNGRGLSCCSLPLLLFLCVFSILIMAAGSLSLRQEVQPVSSASSQIQTLESQNATVARLTQKLGTPLTEDQLAQGQQVYNQTCATCHGPVGQGQFPDAPLEPDSTGRIGAPPHNETGHTWHHSDVSLLRYVIEGGFSDATRYYQMPSFGGVLTDNQVVFVVAYIKTLWTDEQREMQQQLTEEEQAMLSN